MKSTIVRIRRAGEFAIGLVPRYSTKANRDSLPLIIYRNLLEPLLTDRIWLQIHGDLDLLRFSIPLKPGLKYNGIKSAT